MSIAANLMARLTDIFGNIPMSNRNYIVDGCFENFITSPITTAVGAATRQAATMYLCGPGAAGQATYSSIGMLAGGDTIGMTTPSGNWLSVNQTTATTGTVAASTGAFVSQEIENVDTLNKRSFTLSMWLATASGTITIPAIVARQTFGRTGSPSAQVIFDKNVNWVVTTTAKKFSVRIDVPSTVGKTITAGGSVQVGIWLPSGVTFQLYMSQWQVEQSNPQTSSDINGAGGNPTAFEYRGQAAEAERVARYYEVLQGWYGAGAYSAATNMYVPLRYKRKRATPTISHNGVGNFIAFAPVFGSQAPSAVVFNTIWVDSCVIQVTVTGATTGQAGMLEDGNGVSLIAIDARF